MNPQTVPAYRKDVPRDDGMLFVRTGGIIDTMVKTLLIAAGLAAMILAVPPASFAANRTLDLVLYPDGSAHVSAQIDVDPLEPDFETDLFGSSVDNFVAVGEEEFLLSNEITGNRVTIDTFGSSSITVNYDIHDLISKEGRIWTFSLDSPFDYSLLMPANSIIVGMSALPTNMDIDNDQTRLQLSSGPSEITYIFGNADPPDEPEQPAYLLYLALAGVAAAGAAGAIMIKKRQPAGKPDTRADPAAGRPDTETIFQMRPEMRDDDKEIVRFISDNGGQALESDLRKKFLQPRTTMWRAVKRLERQGVIEITKKDTQNLVKLREPEEEK